MRKIMFILLIFLLVNNSYAIDKVRLHLKWYHQAQFAGFYVAKEKNYYINKGIDVSFIEGGPKTSSSAALIEKRTDFAVCSPEDFLKKVSYGLKFKAIASIYRKSAVVFLSRKESGILKPSDFKSKVIAAGMDKSAPEFGMQLRAMLENMNIRMPSVKLIHYDPEYKGFLNGTVDITPAYFTGGMIKLKSRGIKMNIIYPGDFRVRFYSDILVTTQSMINKNPDLVRRFVSASLKGWRYAIENVDKAIPIIMKYSKIKNKVIQRSMLEASVPLIFTGDDIIGWMNLKEWGTMHDILLKQSLISKKVEDLSEIFTTEFIKKE